MKKALVVGINNYPTAPLHGCINDAQAIAKNIETNEDGSPNFTVKLETNINDKAELKALIVDLFNGDSDVALLYFSGHGYSNDIGVYIVAPDYKKNDEGIAMDEILTMANKSGCKNKVIILDCCHSGAFGSPTVMGRSTTNISEGVTILTASRESEQALEIDGHGVFTNLLLSALQGGAADLQGHITPGSIYAYIDQALGPWNQRPVFKTNVTRFVSLRDINPQVSKADLRMITKYFSTPEHQVRLDPSFEDTNKIDVEHVVVPPYAIAENVAIFKLLQKYQSVGLVVPVEAEFMYFAAMNSKSCRLTALGHHYWQLVNDSRI